MLETAALECPAYGSFSLSLCGSGVVYPEYLLSNAPLIFFLHYLKLKAAGSEAIDHFRSLKLFSFLCLAMLVFNNGKPLNKMEVPFRN